MQCNESAKAYSPRPVARSPAIPKGYKLVCSESGRAQMRQPVKVYKVEPQEN